VKYENLLLLLAPAILLLSCSTSGESVLTAPFPGEQGRVSSSVQESGETEPEDTPGNSKDISAGQEPAVILIPALPASGPATKDVEMVIPSLPKPVVPVLIEEVKEGDETAPDTETDESIVNGTASGKKDTFREADADSGLNKAQQGNEGLSEKGDENPADTGTERIAAAPSLKERTLGEKEKVEYDEEILAVVGDTIQISLPDHRWVYDRGASDAGGLEFVDSQYLQTSKEFVFHVIRTGTAILVFQKQNLTTGRSELKTMKIDAAESEYEREIFQAGEADDKSEKVIEEFSMERLVRELEELNLLGLQRQLNWLNTAAREDEQMQVSWDPIIRAAENLEDSPYESTAIESLKLYLEGKNREKDQLAKVYFLLGMMYESPSFPRDEREAVRYYRMVMEIFPTSIYHFRAEDRIKYLERHFLQIR